MKDDLRLAKETLQTRGLSLVLVRGGKLLRWSQREGIADLLVFMEELGAELQGAALADKVVGKAVAMVVRYAGIASVYSPLASQAALVQLRGAGVTLEYDQVVPNILNKQGKDTCPLERLTLALDDPREAVEALREFLSNL